MNLTKLFQTQAKLDEHIMQEHPELQRQNNLDWKLLALQVELGKCANEWRGFKKWSKDQEPRTKLYTWINGIGECVESKNDPRMLAENLQLNAFRIKNSLLEEYVDCLHFILSIGLEDFTYIQFGDKFTGPVRLELTNDFGAIKYHNITTQFLYLSKQISNLADCILECEMVYASEIFEQYKQTWQMFVGLGEMLGFTWKQVEESYYEKNKINHLRQENGY